MNEGSHLYKMGVYIVSAIDAQHSVTKVSIPQFVPQPEDQSDIWKLLYSFVNPIKLLKE